MTLDEKTGKHGSAGDPEYLISMVGRLLMGLVFGAYVAADPVMFSGLSSSSTFLPLASGFRSKPYVYVFAPVWLLITYHVMMATILSIVRSRLNEKSKMYINTQRVLSVVFTVCTACLLFITVPVFKQSSYVVIAVLILIPVFVATTQPLGWRMALFIVVYLALCIASPFSVIGNILLVLWLSFYNMIVPAQPAVYYTMSILPKSDKEIEMDKATDLETADQKTADSHAIELLANEGVEIHA